MLGKTPSYQPQGGSSIPGSLSHVYIQHPPLRCDIPRTRGFYYDDGNKFLLALTSDQVLQWKTGQSGPPNADSIGEGPVMSVRYSLDNKVIGIQRSKHEVELRNRETGKTCSRKCKEAESILGFFWTDCPFCDIIFVKSSGIEQLAYEAESDSIRLVESKKINVSWYVYTHETRMVILASGMQCSEFSGYQFSSGGVVKLPKFVMAMTKSESNSKPVLAEDDVHLVTVYGRVYCFQLDRIGMCLNVYRFFRDAVMLQGTLPVYSPRIAISTVDNVILVHQVNAKVVILYDMFLESLVPISAPLPLLVKGVSSDGIQATQLVDQLSTAYGSTLYGDKWLFLTPDLICDVDNGLLWKISLDLEAIAASSSDVPVILEFLQRRRSDLSQIKALCLQLMRSIIVEKRPIPTIAAAFDILLVSFSHLKKMTSIRGAEQIILEQNQGDQISDGSSVARAESTSVLSDHRNSDSDDNRNQEITEIKPNPLVPESPGAQSSGSSSRTLQHAVGEVNRSPASLPRLGSKQTSVVISPDDLYRFVFLIVEDEMGGDTAYLISVIVEFLKSASRLKLKVHPYLYVMTVSLLARSNRVAELAMFVSSKIIDPSKEVAELLIGLDQQSMLARKLGIDMLRDLSLHHDYVTALLKCGHYLDALRYARKHKVTSVQPSEFLEAAAANKNQLHLAAMLRSLSDLTPNFNTTADYSSYHQVLAEMT